MRLTIVNYSCRKIGGTEQNLDVVLPELSRRGHELQFVYFHDDSPDRARIRTGSGTELVHAGEIGSPAALERIRAFGPTLINAHGDIAADFQSDLLAIAPAAYSVHNYYGTCISGLKTHQFPVIQPCEHILGPACLLRYFPRRCGGRSPVTMFRRYRTERERLAVMSQYDAVITHSRHMELEYMRHGLYPARVYGLPYEVAAEHALPRTVDPFDDGLPLQLLFVGRMEKLKGGQVLLRSLPQVQADLGRPLEVHFAGDGPERSRWEQIARRVMERSPEIQVRFHGWLTGESLTGLLARTHLLVVPSLWPEPFGKVGPEAGLHGIPVAAFAVGGIGEWLTDGVNGMTAAGHPPTSEGLADAIVRCVGDAETYRRLSVGARENVKRFDLQVHVDRLLQLFETICRERAEGRKALAAAG